MTHMSIDERATFVKHSLAERRFEALLPWSLVDIIAFGLIVDALEQLLETLSEIDRVGIIKLVENHPNERVRALVSAITVCNDPASMHARKVAVELLAKFNALHAEHDAKEG